MKRAGIRQLCSGVAAVFAATLWTTAAVAQPTGCGGAMGLSVNPDTFANRIVFTRYPLGEVVTITVEPGPAPNSFPMTLDHVDYALTCANNGDLVPCKFGNDSGATSSTTPMQFDQFLGGTCGVTNPLTADNGDGTLTFEFPPQTFSAGESCSVIFNVLVQDRGTDNTPLTLTGAAQASGTCQGGLNGTARGSVAVFMRTIPAIELIKEISIDGGTTWFDANVPADTPWAAFPSGAMYRLTVTNTGMAVLNDVTINDPTLGIVNANIGTLNIDQSVVLDAGDIAALNQALVCNSAGTFLNTATAEGVSADDGQTVGDSDPANLECVGLDVQKSADDLGKIGDTVNYTISLINDNGFALQNCTANDSLLGTVFGPNVQLPAGTTVLNPSRDAQVGDPDPLVNQVTLNCDAVGPVNTVNLNAFDSAETNLFQPSVTVDKTGPTTAKAGDTVRFTVTLTNNSSPDTPGPINCTANDSLVGIVPIAFGQNQYDFEIPADATGPINNTIDVECQVEGFTNVFGDSDSHSVDLINPAITVTKTGPATAKVGDVITYTIGFASTGTGAVENCTGSDTLLGNLGAFVPGVDRTFDREVLAGDPNPLPNTATITCDVVGFDNQVSDFDDHSVDLIAPAVILAKSCAPDPVLVGGTIEWTIDISNTGDADLDCTLNDATAGITDRAVAVAAGATETVTADRIVELADLPSISNTATVSCAVTGFDNEVGDEASADCEVQPLVEEVCRTPGFWGTHAGEEKRRSSNLTQAVIDAAGGSLSICGQTIDNTDVGNVFSAVEAMCVRIQGDLQRQLARQLTAMALNCVVSGGSAECLGTSVDGLFADANAACTANDAQLGQYIGPVDCFNNGGRYDEATGTCVSDPNNCHERELDAATNIFDGIAPLPGPAGSSRACRDANGNGVKVVPAF